MRGVGCTVVCKRDINCLRIFGRKARSEKQFHMLQSPLMHTQTHTRTIRTVYAIDFKVISFCHSKNKQLRTISHPGCTTASVVQSINLSFLVSRFLNWLLERCSHLANTLSNDFYLLRNSTSTSLCLIWVAARSTNDSGLLTDGKQTWHQSIAFAHCTHTTHTHNHVRLENHMSDDWWTRWVTVSGVCNWW